MTDMLTDQELRSMIQLMRAQIAGGFERPHAIILRGLLELQRHRTPSVPGEDMRAQARRVIGETLVPERFCEDEGDMFKHTLWDQELDALAASVAAFASSTAALAREEERERCAKIAEGWPATFGNNSNVSRGATYASENIAAAIRAIGKEG